jgi:CheY-like chemotaxis protein
MAQILLIDDDALLRDTVRQLLELDGHQVEEACDGVVGLQKLRQRSSVDLVITDMLMPQMDGAQVIVEVKRLRPGLPVLAISGGRRSLSPRFNLDTAVIAGAAQSLSKPFGRAALQAAVESALTH